MTARALSSASLTFGLVSIPIKLFSTNQSTAGISFNLLHDKCRSRLKQQYVCSNDGEQVSRDQMVKGYEFAKDQYVVFTDEELKAIEEQSSKTIEISEFVPASQVDPLFFEGAYYLGPDKGGERAYRLLAEAMTQAGQCAVAKHASRGKLNLVLIRPMGKALVMQQLRSVDEVKPLSEIPIPEDTEIRPAELELAKKFVESLATGEFKPDKYEDVVRKRLQEIIQKKIEGEQVSIAPVEQPKGQIIDLMEALKASLAQHDASGASKGSRVAPVPSTAAPVMAPLSAPVAAVPAERKPTRKAPAKTPAKETAAKEPKKSRSAR